MSRRRMLFGLTGCGLAAGVGSCGAPLGVYVWGPGRAISDAGADLRGPYRACSESELPVGAGLVIETPRGPVIVLRPGEEEVVALEATCTHLGCLVRWDAENGKIRCPCHAALFGTDGAPLEGPATRPLGRWVARLVDGAVEVEPPAGGA